jgi:LytR cell envelope-related transcriptional attenuator
LELLKDIGAYAGLAAFLGLALLSLLYFAQARDVRRLREWAGRAPDLAELSEEELAAAAESADMTAEELERAAAERQAAEDRVAAERAAVLEREERRQRRAAGEGEPLVARVRAFFARHLPQPRYLAVIVGGVIVLGVGVTAGALALFGDGNGGGGGDGGGGLRPGEIEVAVLNGTAVPGLAARIGDQVEAGGFQLGAVTNSPSSFSRTVVMYRRGHQPEAERVGRSLRIKPVRLMTRQTAEISAGADVSVIVGQDRT